MDVWPQTGFQDHFHPFCLVPPMGQPFHHIWKTRDSHCKSQVCNMVTLSQYRNLSISAQGGRIRETVLFPLSHPTLITDFSLRKDRTGESGGSV